MRKIRLAVEVPVQQGQEVFYNLKTEKFTNLAEGNIKWQGANFLETGDDQVMIGYVTPLLLNELKEKKSVAEEKLSPRPKYEKEKNVEGKINDEEKVW